MQIAMPIDYRTRPKGFTLIELLITLVILIILLSLALPAFRSFIADQKIKNASFELNTTLQYARSEAVKRNGSVSVTPVSSDWAQGYTVTTGSISLKTVPAFDRVAITGPTVVTFGKNGRVSVGGGSSFVISPSPALSGVTSRCVKIDTSGLPTNQSGSSC